LISVGSGNEEFTAELSKWAFQEKSVLRINLHKHHRKGETSQHGIYRIKDDMVLTID
jgi:oligosaccharyltransferase complex subunit beta